MLNKEQRWEFTTFRLQIDYNDSFLVFYFPLGKIKHDFHFMNELIVNFLT